MAKKPWSSYPPPQLILGVASLNFYGSRAIFGLPLAKIHLSWSLDLICSSAFSISNNSVIKEGNESKAAVHISILIT